MTIVARDRRNCRADIAAYWYRRRASIVSIGAAFQLGALLVSCADHVLVAWQSAKSQAENHGINVIKMASRSRSLKTSSARGEAASVAISKRAGKPDGQSA